METELNCLILLRSLAPSKTKGKTAMTAEPARDILKFKRETSKRRLNKRAVASMKPPAEKPNGKTDQEWHYDTITARLAICVWSTGAKVWYWTGRIKTGDMIKLKLGTFPESLPTRRKQLAGEISRDVTEWDRPPRRKSENAGADLKLGELHEWYIENHAKPHKKPSSIKEDKRLYKSYLEPWKAKKISTIKRSDVRSLHAKIGRENGRYAANRMLSLLGTMFQKALDADDVDFSGENPARGVKRFAEESRERFLQADELQSFFEALNKLSPIMRDYFLLALLTGARRGNVQAMRWEELNLERGEWRVLDTKGGEAPNHLSFRRSRQRVERAARIGGIGVCLSKPQGIETSSHHLPISGMGPNSAKRRE